MELSAVSLPGLSLNLWNLLESAALHASVPPAWRSISAWGLCILPLTPSLALPADFLEFKLEWGSAVRSVMAPHLKGFFWEMWVPVHISSIQEVLIEDGCIIKSGNRILGEKIHIVSWYSKRTCGRHRIHRCAIEADSWRLLKSTCRKRGSRKH